MRMATRPCETVSAASERHCELFAHNDRVSSRTDARWTRACASGGLASLTGGSSSVLASATSASEGSGANRTPYTSTVSFRSMPTTSPAYSSEVESLSWWSPYGSDSYVTSLRSHLADRG